jgi:hypothetical protein
MGFKGVLIGISIFARKRQWLRSACRTIAEIVDRKEEFYDSGGYGDDHWDYALELIIPTAQAASDPGEQSVCAYLNKRVFDKYGKKDKAMSISHWKTLVFLFLRRGIN